MSSWTPTTYKIWNWPDYNRALKQRGSLALWFDPEADWKARLWKPDTPGARARNEAVRSSKYLGRALWRRWTGYHRRSRVQTKMHCVKLLGQRLAARDFDRQVAEIQIRDTS